VFQRQNRGEGGGGGGTISGRSLKGGAADDLGWGNGGKEKKGLIMGKNSGGLSLEKKGGFL